MKTVNLLVALNFDNFSEVNLFDKLIKYVPLERQSKLLNLQNYKNAFLSLMGELLVRYSLSECLRCSNNDINFYTNDFGKPSLLYHDGFHFNISHSGNKVVVGLMNNAVGVDIEQEKIIGIDIAREYFHINEYLNLINTPKKDQTYYFTALWTLKESFIKFMGKGLTIPLNSFYIRITEDAQVLFYSAIYKEQIKFCHYKTGDNYHAAVCTLKGNIPKCIQWWRVADFTDKVTAKLDRF